MEHTAPSGEPYRYDAFISYRHLPLDMAVAARLQELLESYRPPKNVEGLKQQRISRVFRDTSELPTSGDLGNDISDALKHSRYLIVICSEHIRESRWCMEEINLFKQYHGGRTNHILPLLVSGEPGEAFPRQLLRETRTRTGEDGREQEYDAEIEPLCADVRADTVKKSLKRLKTEFLRIAAPILGCSFDALYQRHLRRQRRRGILALSASLGLLSAVLLVVSLFAYQTWVSERAYRASLAENYMMQGSDSAFADQPQQALMYFSQALSAAPEEVPAAYAGAALLLQEYSWPVMEQQLPGTILNGTYSPCAWAVSELDGTYYLKSTIPDIQVCDAQGTLIREIQLGEDEYATLLTSSAGQWGFRIERQGELQTQRLLLYYPGGDQVRFVEQPQDTSRNYDAETAVINDFSIAAVDGERAVVTGAGLVRLIRFNAQGEAQTLCCADLADAFPLMDKAQTVSTVNDLWVSQDGSLMAVRHLSSIAIYETDGLVLCGTIDTGGYEISQVVFGERGTIALACGNPYSLSGSHMNPGGRFGVYRTNGQVIYQSQPDQENAFLGLAFAPENDNLLLVWSKTMAAVFDLEQERFLTAPVYSQNITSACFYDDGSICVASSVNALQGGEAAAKELVQYRYICLPRQQLFPEEGEGEINTPYESEKRVAYGPDGKSLVSDGWTLTMYDEDGEHLASRELPRGVLASRIALSEDGTTVYLGDSAYYSGLLSAPVDFAQHTIGDFTSGDTNGGTVLNLWTLGSNGAVETSSREIMVFRPDGERIFSSVPRHSAMPVGIVTDPFQRYIGLCLKETTTQQGIMGYGQNSIIEVWDIASGLLVADYRVAGKELDTLGITGDGILFWGTGSQMYSRLIPAQGPDKEALSFLTSLCSLTLNQRQEDVSQIPLRRELSEENWYSSFGGWQEVSFEREKIEDQTLSTAVLRLSGEENAGSSQWIAQCDEVWRALGKGELSGSMSELDLFFETYSILACNSGRAEELGYGLETYFELVMEVTEASEDVVSGSLVSNVLPVLCETTSFDKLVAEGFEHMAASTEEDVEQTDRAMEQEIDEMELLLWEEIDRPLMLISASQFRGWAACLTGEDPLSAWLDVVRCCLDYNVLPYQLCDAYTTVCLLHGDAADAAQLMNQALAEQILGLSQEDLEIFEDYFSEHLESLELMLYRGLIDPGQTNGYLEALNADFGLKVVGVGAEAQESGIRLGDAITAVDGQKITSLAMGKRLLSQEGAECTLQREGRQLTVPVSEGLVYEFYCTLS